MAISAGIAAIASATAAANGYTLAAIAAGAFMIVAGVGVAFMVRQNPPG
ncbi:MAG: hypothetical protein OJF48_003375 [Afipia sp.]|nr:MAG: hypothetical protein OJF48_003375 [Afipia sp.]